MKQILAYSQQREREREKKKWEIKTWEKWYWGIVEVVFFVIAIILTILDQKGKNPETVWSSIKIISFLFLIWNAITLIIWGITKLIIWLVNRNKKEIDN